MKVYQQMRRSIIKKNHLCPYKILFISQLFLKVSVSGSVYYSYLYWNVYNNYSLNYNRLGLLRIHPLCTIRYVNSNELLPVLRNGKHQICQGPGYFWVTHFNDRVFPRISIGENINFGPIKLIYVRPGGIKFAVNVSTSHPMLLGPGMHYFDDVNVTIDPREIILDSQGENKVLRNL